MVLEQLNASIVKCLEKKRAKGYEWSSKFSGHVSNSNGTITIVLLGGNHQYSLHDIESAMNFIVWFSCKTDIALIEKDDCRIDVDETWIAISVVI